MANIWSAEIGTSLRSHLTKRAGSGASISNTADFPSAARVLEESFSVYYNDKFRKFFNSHKVSVSGPGSYGHLPRLRPGRS